MAPITVKMLSLLILGFDDDKNPNESEIVSAYRNLAKVFHPDMPNGSKEQFRALSTAKEYLVANLPKAAPTYSPAPSYSPQPDFAQRQREQRERWEEHERQEKQRREQQQKEQRERQKKQFTDIPW